MGSVVNGDELVDFLEDLLLLSDRLPKNFLTEFGVSIPEIEFKLGLLLIPPPPPPLFEDSEVPSALESLIFPVFMITGGVDT